MNPVSNRNKDTKVLLFLAVTIGFVAFSTNSAYAAHTTSGFVADDPDNGDIVYSVGDTLTLTFSAPTNQSGAVTKANIDGNFTFALPDISAGSTYTGTWTDPSTLVITITGAGASPTIGVTTATPTAGTNIGDAGSTHALGGGGVALSGDFGLQSGGGGGCHDCTAPTLGVNKLGIQLVDNGFSYNRDAVDVERFYTPYPLVKAFIARDNVATLKIFDDGGPQNIRHLSLAFGLGKGEILSQSKAVIEWNKSWDGTETVTEFDPENALDNISVESSYGACKSDVLYSTTCLILDIHHTFRAPLDFDIIGTDVWDSKGNSWHNYYNHGVSVEGDSLNAPEKHLGIYQGQIVSLTEIGENKALDEYGNSWSYQKTWVRDYQIPSKDGSITTKGIDRNNALFNTYKQGQILLGKQVFDAESVQNDSLTEPFTITSQFLKRSEDVRLQNDIMKEQMEAKLIVEKLINSHARHY